MECKTCGNDHPESYCPACGEKAFNPKQLSLKHFVEEAFEGFIHFDSKFFRTVKILITKPGQLSLDYTQGRRVLYMKPIQFFLVVNLIYFVLALYNMYSIPLYAYTHYQPFINFNTEQIVDNHLAAKKISLAGYEQFFNEKIKELSKAFIFVFIPFYGLIFSILFLKKKTFFVEHLVFAIHFCTFVLLLSLLLGYLTIVPLHFFPSFSNSINIEYYSGKFVELCVVIYAGIAIHRFYRPRIVWTIIISLLIGYTFFDIILAYRILLFFKIIYLS